MKYLSTQMFAVMFASVMFLGSIPTVSAQDVIKACEGDIKKYCSQVTLGDGRLLACMYAHEDKLSVQCDVAIADAADQLDWFMDRVRTAIAQCAPDIEKHCANVEIGQGRIFMCLKIKRNELANECKAVVDRVAERLTAQ